ncbi:MAG: hypothetical protein ACFFDP_02235 [Promethearchaeota archaeon]
MITAIIHHHIHPTQIQVTPFHTQLLAIAKNDATAKTTETMAAMHIVSIYPLFTIL